MLFRGSALILFALSLAAMHTVAQDPPEKNKATLKAASKLDPAAKAAVGDPTEFEVIFKDGSIIKVQVLEKALTATTKYGKLAVPVADLRKITLGMRFPAGAATKIAEAVTKLGDDNPKTRDEAQKDLTEFGDLAIPALRKSAGSGDAEVARRSDEILKKLASKGDGVRLKDHDVVETAEFAFKGSIDEAEIKVKTKQFGESTIKLDLIKSLRNCSGKVDSGEISLDSAKYAKQNWAEWYDTGIEVSTDDAIEISASGQIDQWAQSPGQYVSQPGGTGSGVNPPANMRMNKGGMPMLRISSGALYGRIGTDGQMFLIGASFKGKPNASGKLYLIIAPSNWGNDSSGSYKVTVKNAD